MAAVAARRVWSLTATEGVDAADRARDTPIAGSASRGVGRRTMPCVWRALRVSLRACCVDLLTRLFLS